jgi:hypothetical protein
LSEGEHLPAQIQNLYAQIGKEYGVVRRFRQPVEEALARMEPKREPSSGNSAVAVAPGSPSPAVQAAQRGKARAATEPSRGRRLVDTDTPRAVYGGAGGGAPVARAPNAEMGYAKPHPQQHQHQHQQPQQQRGGGHGAHAGPSTLKGGRRPEHGGGALTSHAVASSSPSAAVAHASASGAAQARGAAATVDGRKGRVSFNVPPPRAAAALAADDSERDEDEDEEEEDDGDDDDDDDGPLVLVASAAGTARDRHAARHDEALEISRRLWDLGNVGRDDIVVGK